MKKMLRNLILGGVILASPSVFAQSGAVSLDHVDGLINSSDTVDTSTPLTFHIRINNSTGETLRGVSNGFRIYSPEGVLWNQVGGASTGTIDSTIFELSKGIVIDTTALDQNTDNKPDTIGIWGARLFAGLASGFDDVYATITLNVLPNLAGGTICLDSAFFGQSTGDSWLWSGVSQDFTPAWDGPHCFIVPADPMSVEDDDSEALPEGIELIQNYPNPFNPSTTISFELSERSSYSVTIYNTIGQLVQEFNGGATVGRVNIDWDASDYSSGIYFYRLEVASGNYVKKMVLLK
ncbi:MAG: T9SS type A sorting domain-containing protein [bacterium]|nr:T9SS type A sorting domain-containing protein [bacterium]